MYMYVYIYIYIYIYIYSCLGSSLGAIGPLARPVELTAPPLGLSCLPARLFRRRRKLLLSFNALLLHNRLYIYLFR